MPKQTFLFANDPEKLANNPLSLYDRKALPREILYRAFLFILLVPMLLGAADRRVERIDIVVERAPEQLDPATIRSQLKTKVGETFSQLDFDEDLKHLSDEYDRIEPNLEMKGDEVIVTLRIWPKPVIRAINWMGNQHVKSRKLQKELGIKPGTTFDRTAFNQAFHKVQDLYIKKGYFQAQLTYSVEQDASDNAVDICVNVDEGRPGHVKRIIFQGLDRKEEADLLQQVRTKKHFFLTSWMTHSGIYHGEMVEQDRYIVLSYLQNEGYADARVDLEVIESRKGDGLVLLFRVDKGPLYDFGSITFEGNTLFSDEQIAEQISIRRGEPYSPERLREVVKKITDLYGSKGYIEALVTHEPHLVSNEAIYDVDFSIDEGEQYRVGVVKIFGNQRTQQRVLRHESALCPGDVFDIRKLQATEATLRNIGYFECVNVYAVRPAEDPLIGPKYRDVHIEVEETGTGHFGLNFGYSSMDNVNAGIEIVERNFCIAGLKRVGSEGPAALRGGGEFAQLKANLGRKRTQILAAWTKPFFNDTWWIVGVDAQHTINKQVSDEYFLKTTTLSLNATYPFNCFLRFGWHYRISYTDIAFTRDHEQLSKELTERVDNVGALSATGVTLAYDSTNVAHSRGFRSLLEGEYAGVYGEFYFFSFAYLNTYYLSLRNYGCLKLRGEMRFIQPLKGEDNVPISERLFLGGETTMRGFAPYSVGPDFPGTDTPRGGFSSVLLSAEFNRKFFEQLDGFCFVDGGYVAFERWRFRHLEWSVGFGIRLNLMGQMPLIFGWGFPLNPDRKNEIQRFFFTVGGRF